MTALDTPYFLYDAAIIRDRCAELRDAFAAHPIDLFYAVKANDNPAVIAIVHDHGIGACLVSAGEMKRAIAGGIKPERMLMNGVGKSEADIRFALGHGIGQLNVESIPELTVIADIAKSMGLRAKIGVRVNPEIEAIAHAHTITARRTDKFGLLIEDLPGAAAIIQSRPELDWRGLSCHIGSQIHGTDELAASYRRMVSLFTDWRARVPSFDRLDLGGGFGVSYTGEAYARPAAYAASLAAVCRDLMTEGVTIQLEPGRFIAAEAGTLVTKVLYVKNSGGTRFVIVDAAMNNLIRPALYGAYHPITALNPSAAPLSPCIVAGPVCESGDVFGDGYALPDDVRAGDLLQIGFAGAYGMAMSSQYNARDRLAEHLKDGDEVRMVRRALSAEEVDRLTLV